MRRLLVLALLLWAFAIPAPAAAEPPPTDEVDVSFTVRNTNRSGVPCPSDGRTYTVKGTLVGPADALAAPSTSRIKTRLCTTSRPAAGSVHARPP